MSLPVGQLAHGSVEVLGQAIEFRGLSRREVLKCGTQYKEDPDACESYVIACATGVSFEEAQAWRESTDPHEAGKLVDAIIQVSGIQVLAAGSNGSGPKA